MKDKIDQFNCHDDVGYLASGKRSTITVKQNGSKSKLQRRYLPYSLRKIYQLFFEENQGIALGRSTFQELRPLNVLHKSLIPHKVCFR